MVHIFVLQPIKLEGGKMAIGFRSRMTIVVLIAVGLFMLASPKTGEAAGRRPAPYMGRTIVYVVQRGDTLYSIARRYNTSVAAIKRANGLTSNNIFVGQRLRIPVKNNPVASSGVWYVVKKGDTLYSIAKRYNTSVAAIKRANGLSSNLISVGQRLWIPTTSLPPPRPPRPPAPKPIWTGLFFNNRELKGPAVLSANTPTIDFDWGEGSPGDKTPNDDFSATWTGNFRFRDGDYRFFVTVDDGARLYMDDELLIDAWREQSKTGYFRDVHVTDGEHRLRVEYFDATGRASITVWWKLR